MNPPASTPASTDNYQDALAAAALLGTGRASLPAPPDNAPALARLLAEAQRSSSTAEAALLSSAAVAGLWHKAGALPIAGSALMDAPDLPNRDSPCPPRAAAHLDRILSGDQRPVLREWLAVLQARGCSLPPRWLPESLDLASTADTLRPALVAVLGARGRWLARQNPEWASLLPPETPEAVVEQWQTGDRATRLFVLRTLRATTPDVGRALLGSTWDQEPPDERVVFLPVLSSGLSLADEPFLESCLSDRRKDVRTGAADLLCRLPGSRLVARMSERLQPRLSLKRRVLAGFRLTVQPPDKCDEVMAHDGIVSKPPPGLGEQAWWLFQMLAAVPPATWSDGWHISPPDLVRAAAGDENAGALLTGWARAAARSRDGAWAEALLRRYAEAPWTLWPSDGNRFFLDDAPALLTATPQESLESWLAEGLTAAAPRLEPTDLWIEWLRAHRRPWSMSFTRVVLTVLRRVAEQAQEPWRAVSWRPALADCALVAAPELAGESMAFLGEESWLRPAIEPFLNTLFFRAEMLAAFDGPL